LTETLQTPTANKGMSNGKRYLSRGVLRLWLVGSAAWLVWTAVDDRGGVRVPWYEVISYQVQAATLRRVPVEVPHGSVAWSDLSTVQQDFVKQGTLLNENAVQGSAEYYAYRSAKMSEWDPSPRYEIVPAADLREELAERCQRKWTEPHRAALFRIMAEFLKVGLGIPVLVGCVLLLARWIWAGFVSAK
jgi:hypothetical protein